MPQRRDTDDAGRLRRVIPTAWSSSSSIKPRKSSPDGAVVATDDRGIVVDRKSHCGGI